MQSLHFRPTPYFSFSMSIILYFLSLYSFILLFFYFFIHIFLIHLFIYSLFICSLFIYSNGLYSSVPLFLFLRSSVRLFICSSVHLFICSLFLCSQNSVCTPFATLFSCSSNHLLRHKPPAYPTKSFFEPITR